MKRKEIDYSLKKLLIYCAIFLTGLIIMFLASFLFKGVCQTITVSLSTGLIASALTAGAIDISHYIDFRKKRKYRRNVELRYLSREMITLARLITEEHKSNNIKLIIVGLEKVKQKKENKKEIISLLNLKRLAIEKELNNIRTIQDYLSLSGFFSDEEVVFLCRSINYYAQVVGESNETIVIDNIIDYLTMFCL